MEALVTARQIGAKDGAPLWDMGLYASLPQTHPTSQHAILATAQCACAIAAAAADKQCQDEPPQQAVSRKLVFDQMSMAVADVAGHFAANDRPQMIYRVLSVLSQLAIFADSR